MSNNAAYVKGWNDAWAAIDEKVREAEARGRKAGLEEAAKFCEEFGGQKVAAELRALAFHVSSGGNDEKAAE